MRVPSPSKRRGGGAFSRVLRRPRVAIVAVVVAGALLWIVAFTSLELTTVSSASALVSRRSNAASSADLEHGDYVSVASPPVSPCPTCPDCSTTSGTGPRTPHPDAVTFVLVATMRPNDGPRAVALLASMRRFLDPKASAVHALVVIVPNAELTWWRLAAQALRGGGEHGEVFFEVRVVAEDDVLPTPTARLRVAAPKANQRESRGAGYRVQMLLKLAVAANHVHTDFYVTLDCDVLLAKPLKLGTLVRAGKALTQGEMGGPHVSRWMSHSLDAFFGDSPGASKGKEGADRCGVQTLKQTIGVTPAVLSTRVALAAIARLQTLGGDVGWDERLFRTLDEGLDWTEYGMYAAGACLEGMQEEVHYRDPKLRLYDATLQEDGSRFRDPAAMSRAFDADAPVFLVLQSIGGSDAAGAAEAVWPHLSMSDGE